MPAENQVHVRPAESSEDTADMTKYGIIRTPVDYFYLGKYRYTDLKDAIAQARREVTAMKGALPVSK